MELSDVERSNHRAVEYQKKMYSERTQESQFSKEYENSLRVLELRLKEIDLLIESLRRELENVRLSNDALLDRNHDHKLELESLS